MVDKEKQVIAFIHAKKKTPNFEVAVVSRFGEVGEYYLQLIQTEARFQQLREEIEHEQSRYAQFSEDEIQVIAFIESRKNVLYFEDSVLASFGEFGRHCLHLVETEPLLRPLRDEIIEEQKRFAVLQQQRNPHESPEERQRTLRLHYLR